MSDSRITFSPNWDGDTQCSSYLVVLASNIASVQSTDPAAKSSPEIDDVEEEFLRGMRTSIRPSESHRLEAAGRILVDLARQGWTVEVDNNVVVVIQNDGDGLSVQDQKNRIREQELIKRNEQLATPSVRRFIQNMESSRLHADQFVSVFSLMRDGQELAELLKNYRDRGILADGFQEIIQPYVQVIESEVDECQFTGLKLTDIWRYFRHTWTNQSNSVPGRSMRLLVRDRAAPNHPVIGIASIGSPIVALTPRDKEIGWDGQVFLQNCRSMLPTELLAWVAKSFDQFVEGVYLTDLFEEGIVDNDTLCDPNDQVIERLKMGGETARNRHHEHGLSADYKTRLSTDEDCSKRARQDLFKYKRCFRLVELLGVRKFLRTLEGLSAGDAVDRLLDTKDGRQALTTLIRARKGEVIGIDVADITVCGALPPYGPILGGKLVSALTASPEIIHAYNEKYSAQTSEIASGMAGRIIKRKPQLVLLGTTSLYGASSSQYNRIKVPCEDLGGVPGSAIQFKLVGKTDSFGSSQFSEKTVQALANLRAKSKEGTRVNSIFGEGVSPKLRKIRDGLQTLGVPQSALLKHARHRAIYMIPVAKNYSEYLMGFDAEPEYLIPIEDTKSVSQKVVDWWVNRWALNRSNHDDVIAAIRRHDFTYPIEHGARVQGPEPISYQGPLFE